MSAHLFVLELEQYFIQNINLGSALKFVQIGTWQH